MPKLSLRASSIGKLMTDPTAAAMKAGEVLSAGAKTYIRELAAQDVLGIDFEIGSKQIEKGNACEDEAIQLLNRVRGVSLVKNSERKDNGWVSGECDLFDEARKIGHDIKCSWSASTFPLLAADVGGSLRNVYEWQMRAYMWLWDANEWHVDTCLINTPEKLIGFEPMTMHVFNHIPDSLRVTSWVIRRDKSLEEAMTKKIIAARSYYETVINDIEREHSEMEQREWMELERERVETMKEAA